MTLLGRLRESGGAERRALTAWGDWSPSTQNESGVDVDEHSALNFSAVWACQTLIADAIATQPVDVYMRGLDGTRTELVAPSWIEQPNPYSDRIDYDTQRVLSLLGWGNCYEFVIRRGGKVHERYVLDPSKVRVYMEAGAVRYDFDGQKLPEGSVLHTMGYRLPGDLTGLSPIKAATQSIGLGVAAETYNAAFFGKGAIASGILSVPEMPVETSQAVVERLREAFEKRHASVRNAHKPMVLTGGTKWEQTSVNPEDAQLLESRKFQVSEIARWYRVPPHLISDVERSTSWGTGIEQQSIAFVQHTLTPWTVRLERADSLLVRNPRFVKRNMAALLRGDTTARGRWYLAGHGRWMTTNEIRALEDMPPIEGGDDLTQNDPGAPNFGDDGAPTDGSIEAG